MFYHYGRVASEKGVNYAKNSDSRYQRILTEIQSDWPILFKFQIFVCG